VLLNSPTDHDRNPKAKKKWCSTTEANKWEVSDQRTQAQPKEKDENWRVYQQEFGPWASHLSKNDEAHPTSRTAQVQQHEYWNTEVNGNWTGAVHKASNRAAKQEKSHEERIKQHAWF